MSLVLALTDRLPATRPRWVQPVLWANLVGEIGIVVTGGIVRLTGSGLGCSTWPECEPGSFTPVATPENSLHGLIEFGNRLLTGVVGLLALATIWVVATHWPQRRRMRWLSLAVLAGVVAQAVVGGITVRTGLNPWTVMFHFLMSMALVAVSAALVRGARDDVSGPGPLTVLPLARQLGLATAAAGAVVLVLGTIVTGSGPHSGDADTPARTGFDPRTMSWLHADAVILFCGLVLATMVAVWLSTPGDEPEATDDSARVRRSWVVVLMVTLLQGAIGYVQYFTGLPEVLVLLHMLGASLLVVALSWAVLEMRRQPV